MVLTFIVSNLYVQITPQECQSALSAEWWWCKTWNLPMRICHLPLILYM